MDYSRPSLTCEFVHANCWNIHIDFDYEEMDEIDLFKRWDKKIWDDYMNAKKQHFAEQEEDEGEEENNEEDVDEFDEDGKKIEFDDGFDKEGFISQYVEEHPGIDENRVKYVVTLGVCILVRLSIERECVPRTEWANNQCVCM